MRIMFAAGLLAASLVTAQAQGIIGGAEQGASDGNRAAGPVGAIVGGAVGGVTGGISGLLGIDQRPRFREYVVTARRPSYQYTGNLTVGTELPENGVTYYEVPREYGVQDYRYTVVNERPVLVDTRTRRVIQIIE